MIQHTGSAPGSNTWPMFGPLGDGYGSVSFQQVDWAGNKIKFKVYPRFVHALKAQRPGTFAPKTVKGAKGRETTAKRIIRTFKEEGPANGEAIVLKPPLKDVPVSSMH